jgi:hypothetical protein
VPGHAIDDPGRDRLVRLPLRRASGRSPVRFERSSSAFLRQACQRLARAPGALRHQAAASSPAKLASNATSTTETRAMRPSQRSRRPPVVPLVAITARYPPVWNYTDVLREHYQHNDFDRSVHLETLGRRTFTVHRTDGTQLYVILFYRWRRLLMSASISSVCRSDKGTL